MRHDSHYVDTIARSSRSIGKTIAIDLISPNPEQPRNEFGDLAELSASIKEKGVLEPLLVKPNGDGTWMIIAGERRWRASGLAGLSEVPCIEMNLDEQGIAEIALIENLQRKDLNVWEEADGLAALASKFGYTQEQIAQKISKSRTTVTELMTIAGLPLKARERCSHLKISSKATLLEIARQFDEAAMYEYLDALETDSKLPKHKMSTVLKENGGTPERKDPNRKYHFVSPDKDFELNIRFFKGETADKKAILKALKQTFDAIKSENTDT
ncbi:MAG: ParB/RepB/Spo0J family partition protein [Blastocatellia bacterium]